MLPSSPTKEWHAFDASRVLESKRGEKITCLWALKECHSILTKLLVFRAALKREIEREREQEKRVTDSINEHVRQMKIAG